MRNQIRKLVLILAVTSMVASQYALAADPAAGFLVGLFMKACIPNMGRPSGVEAWADEWHLNEITDAIPLQVFVGPGGNGKAWAVPTKYGSFALSIRGTTRACAVWARAADPGEVEADFHKLIDGSKRPGLNLKVVEDKFLPGPTGQLHELVYQMSANDAPTGFLFTLIAAENPEGPFQATLQVAATRIPSSTN